MLRVWKGRGFRALFFLLALGAAAAAGSIYFTAEQPSNAIRSDTMFDFATLASRNPRNTALYADPGDAPTPADHPALRFAAAPDVVFAVLTDALSDMPRTRIIEGVPGSLRIYAVQRSLVFRFPDDVHAEVRAEGSGARILLFSASRYGEGDFGVNKRRLEGLATSLRARIGG